MDTRLSPGTHPHQVLMTSTSFPANLNDWRGLFIRHLADALARRADIQLHLWSPPGDAHPAIIRATTHRESAFLETLLQQGGIAHLLRNGGLSGLTAAARLLAGLGAVYRRTTSLDLYHVNWLQNAIPLANDGKPLLVSVLGTDLQLLSKSIIKSLLRRIFQRHPTIICPNADWMLEPLSRTFGDIAEIRFVPFGIDPMWYEISRDAIPDEPKRWLAVTRLTQAKLGPLLDWGEAWFPKASRELHLFGPMQETIELPDWVHYHGPASPETLCKDAFPSAYGLITLSRHAEGRPQVMLEAMAAGLPIVASRLPAHENFILHGETGWLCADPDDVAQGMMQLERLEENRRVGLAARAWAHREIGTWDDCAERYVALYRQLLQRTAHA